MSDPKLTRVLEKMGEPGHEDTLGLPVGVFGSRGQNKSDSWERRGEPAPNVVLVDELDVASSELTAVEFPEHKPMPEQVMYKPFFDLVANKENWKNPIDAVIDAPADKADRDLFLQMISNAVRFYAGCVPLILDLGDKQIGVKADGYYKAVGA